MWDHIFFGPSYAVQFPTFNDLLNHPQVLLSSATDYFLGKSGPLTSNLVDLLGWEKLPEKYCQIFSSQTRKQLAEFPEDWPEVEYLSTDGYIGDFSSPIAQQPRDGKNYATVLGAMVAPISRGNVTLRSASALDKPLINPNWLTAQADQEVAIACYRRMRDVWRTKELQSIVIGEEKWPGKTVDTDEQILNVVRSSLMTIWHPACTCKMGRKGDPMAVVDSQGRVFGVGGLRVIDASAFPLLPPGHPRSIVYALAEKIAEDIIRGEN